MPRPALGHHVLQLASVDTRAERDAQCGASCLPHCFCFIGAMPMERISLWEKPTGPGGFSSSRTYVTGVSETSSARPGDQKGLVIFYYLEACGANNGWGGGSRLVQRDHAAQSYRRFDHAARLPAARTCQLCLWQGLALTPVRDPPERLVVVARAEELVQELRHHLLVLVTSPFPGRAPPVDELDVLRLQNSRPLERQSSRKTAACARYCASHQSTVCKLAIPAWNVN